MLKEAAFLIAQPPVAQLEKCNFTLPIKHLDWTHNLIIMQQVKDIRARYWYMVQSITSHWSKRYLQEAIQVPKRMILKIYRQKCYSVYSVVIFPSLSPTPVSLEDDTWHKNSAFILSD